MATDIRSRTLSDFKTQTSKKSKNKWANSKLPLIDTAYLTLYDYERIRKNAYNPTKEEELNEARIKSEQEYDKTAKARALKDKIKNFDKNRPKYELSNEDRERIERNNDLQRIYQRVLDNNEDCVKQMEKLSLFARVATIRDRQKAEHKEMEKVFKKKEDKLDTMMELERLKELKLQQDRELYRKIQNKNGCLIVIDQIKDKDRERMKQQELIDREQKMMLLQIKELHAQEIRAAELKKINNEKAAKEIAETNRIALLNKQKKLLEEREEDLKIFKYNVEKAKKEEEELREKKRIQDEKEKETQRLREKQEKAIDKQAELDALRAKRAFDEAERQARIKEKEEEMIRKKKLADLILANEKQKKEKEIQLMEKAKQEKEEYEKIVRNQIEEMEKERRIEEEKQRKKIEHNLDLVKLIKEKEEREKMKEREIIEEYRRNKQIRDDWLRRMEKIKHEKIQKLKDLNIKPEYIADLENFQIIS